MWMTFICSGAKRVECLHAAMIDNLLCTRGNRNIWSFTELIPLEVFQHSGHGELISDRLRNWKEREGILRDRLAWWQDNPRAHLCSGNTTCGLVFYLICHSSIPPHDFDTKQCMFFCSFWVWCLRWNFNGVKNQGREEKIITGVPKHSPRYSFSNFVVTSSCLIHPLSQWSGILLFVNVILPESKVLNA